ncbi:Uncharacterised protein [Salmonella enterica subsp. enterica serovar Bovismorbificans]|uniref:Uncharacterized protein n=1 Tax=Salmonella enterica subsp. enterica serovar Bovismorbificans TaxID=58097 RepID=A0A655DA44_SALET|nr:Uncharacterised protein [Salmonella enterica subsp. enterica serovar Bovismorbificans]CNU53355.1 Uncharacterised protein [Salmonella enterica subsp. enterica serovar Bovismorbificans]CNU56811.1 Uncharacterised protein [Salmonella enterica subsp. enterica serovar Bovismorbificans]CNV17634.1 Uncharacterised protein [Salmonella enterica subsp. enterica serovar Bovismorbificans]CPR51581.1 Uncharacterised protein [Salmonella enterica subsp. enterica serovar Bovismorbificans]
MGAAPGDNGGMERLVALIPFIEHMFTGIAGFQFAEHMRSRQDLRLPRIIAAFNRQAYQHRFHIGARVKNIEEFRL